MTLDQNWPLAIAHVFFKKKKVICHSIIDPSIVAQGFLHFWEMDATSHDIRPLISLTLAVAMSQF